MKLTQAEIEQIRARGLYITEKCDACGKILNQTMRYTIAGKPEVYCTAACRDRAFLGAKEERVVNSEKCFRCHQHKHPGDGLYCDRCGTFADPHSGKVEAVESRCKVCGEPVPVLRRGGGSGTCSTACASALRQRRYRERNDAVLEVAGS